MQGMCCLSPHLLLELEPGAVLQMRMQAAARRNLCLPSLAHLLGRFKGAVDALALEQIKIEVSCELHAEGV